MNKEFSCENCKYYVKHYFLFNCRLIYAHSGHCTAPRRKHIVNNKDYCIKWELSANEQPNIKGPIEKNLLQMAKQIKEIAAILKCEQ